MLHVLLTILMVLGMIIGGILALLLFFAMLLLFVPIRYKSEGSYKETFDVKFSITWLLHILSLKIEYSDDKKFHWAFRIFGIKLFRKKASRKKVIKKTAKIAKNSTEIVAEDVVGMEEDIEDGFTETDLRREDREKADSDHSEDSRGWFSKLMERFKSFYENLKFTFIKICDKLKAIKDSWQAFMKFIKDEDNKAGIRFIKEQFFVILRHIKPKKLSLKLRIGFEDPALTGMAVGGLSMLYGFYKNNVEVISDFENPVLEGEYHFRGRIRAWNILVICLKLFFDKNSNRLIKRFFR